MNNILSQRIRTLVSCFKCGLNGKGSNLKFFISSCCLVIHCEYCSMLNEGSDTCPNCKTASRKNEIIDFNNTTSIIVILIGIIENMHKKNIREKLLNNNSPLETPISRINEYDNHIKPIQNCIPVKPIATKPTDIAENVISTTPRKNKLFSFETFSPHNNMNGIMEYSHQHHHHEPKKIENHNNIQEASTSTKTKGKSTLDIKDSPIFKVLKKKSSISSAFSSLIESKYSNVEENKKEIDNENNKVTIGEKKEVQTSGTSMLEQSPKSVPFNIKDKFEFFRKNKEKRFLSVFQSPTSKKRKLAFKYESPINSEE